MSKARFTLERHKQVGLELHRIREQLVHLSVEVRNAYPSASKACRRARKAQIAVDELRSALDDELYREHADNGQDLKGVYYGLGEP